MVATLAWHHPEIDTLTSYDINGLLFVILVLVILWRLWRRL